MFTAISAIVGLLGSVLPSVVRLFERKAELNREIEVAKIQYNIALAAGQNQLDIANIKADVDEGESLRSYDDLSTDSSFIKALRSSVRPVVTYALFGMFLVVKGSAAYIMVKTGTDVPTMIQAIWDGDTASLFAAVVMFWFGTRAYEKSRRYNSNLAPEPAKKPAPVNLNKK